MLAIIQIILVPLPILLGLLAIPFYLVKVTERENDESHWSHIVEKYKRSQGIRYIAIRILAPSMLYVLCVIQANAHITTGIENPKSLLFMLGIAVFIIFSNWGGFTYGKSKIEKSEYMISVLVLFTFAVFLGFPTSLAIAYGTPISLYWGMILIKHNALARHNA